MRTPEQSIAIHQCLRILGSKHETFAKKRDQLYGARVMARWLLDEHPDYLVMDGIEGREIWEACLELALTEARRF